MAASQQQQLVEVSVASKVQGQEEFSATPLSCIRMCLCWQLLMVSVNVNDCLVAVGLDVKDQFKELGGMSVSAFKT